jgi:hypothetical protein
MSPKDKAEELVNKYLMNTPVGFHIDDAKECALIAMDEIIKQCWDYRDIDLEASYDYWNEVKKEIEKL